MKNEKCKMLADREGISHFIVEGDAQWVIDETQKKKTRQANSALIAMFYFIFYFFYIYLNVEKYK